jgi:multiple sugar transport system permease protein
MFNSDIGIINHMLMQLRIIKEPIQWLSMGNTAMTSIIIANIWKGVPFNMILLASALTTLPSDVFEAASIDGANALQRFIYITIPLLKPAIISVLTLGFIYTFKVFDLVYVMTGGGPGSSTEMLSTLAYRYSFGEYNFSQGAAAANVLFVLLMAVGLIYIRIVNKEEEDQ